MQHLKKSNSNDLKAAVDRRLTLLPPPRAEEVLSSPLIYVFGSLAAGVECASSDVDLLVLSEMNTHWRENGLDVVTITPTRLRDPRWLGGELATHIATYGVLIKGPHGALSNSTPNAAAVFSKEKRIKSYLNALRPKWRNFDRLMKEKYVLKVKQELLRLGFLKSRISVPPTALLEVHAESLQLNALDTLEEIVATSSSRFLSDLRARMIHTRSRRVRPYPAVRIAPQLASGQFLEAEFGSPELRGRNKATIQGVGDHGAKPSGDHAATIA
jgi:hypothetical protein